MDLKPTLAIDIAAVLARIIVLENTWARTR
jgi:hypothetical protein